MAQTHLVYTFSDRAGQGLLAHACRAGDETVVARLLAAGAGAGARDVRGRTPLHAACEAECAGDGACIALLFAALEAQSGAERAARADALRRRPR